jgi:hypothetical protein
MATNDITRPYYYQGQFLGAEDFNEELAYHRDMRRRHNLALHTHGIVVGLTLAINSADNEAYVMPGMAVDGYGREILVLRPHKLEPSDFVGLGSPVEVWIRYAEEQTARASRGYELCRNGEQFERLRELFKIVPANNASPQREPDSVTVDGQPARPPTATSQPSDITIPLDRSTPYQELPAGDDAFWHLRLGTVTVDSNGRITAVTNEFRRYAGNVSEMLLAPNGALTVKDRTQTSPLGVDAAGNPLPGVAVTVEGSLTVNRDITADEDVHVDGHVGIGVTAAADIPLVIDNIATTPANIWLRAGNGGDNGRFWVDYGVQNAPRLVLSDQDDPPRLQFQQTGTQTEDSPQHLSWIGHGQGNNNAIAIMGSSIQVGIGTTSPQQALDVSGNLRLSGGVVDTPTTLTLQTSGQARLAIDSNGWVGIGTTAPTSALHVKGDDPDLSLDLNSASPTANWAELRFCIDGSMLSHIYLDKRDNKLYLRNQGSVSLIVDQSRVGIGTSTPREALEVQGDIRLRSDGELFALGGLQNLAVIAGRVDGTSSSPPGGTGYTVVKAAGQRGTYTVNFTLPSPFSAAPAVVATAVDSVGVDHIVTVNSVSSNSFGVVILDAVPGQEGQREDTDFSFIALGART